MEPNRTCAHILFSRIPVPGKVKTRLEPALSAEQCAAFQEALIVDTALKLLKLDHTMMFCYADEEEPANDSGRYFDELYRCLHSTSPGESRVVAYPQRGADLGERMSNAIADAFMTGANACLLLGSDLPYIMPSDIARAEQLLADVDIVFGPSPDGGYWLVGMKEPFPELFVNGRYGQGDVLKQALVICRRHGKTVAFAPSSSDVDNPQDFELLRSRISAGDARIGPHTKQIVVKLFGGIPKMQLAFPSQIPQTPHGIMGDRTYTF